MSRTKLNRARARRTRGEAYGTRDLPHALPTPRAFALALAAELCSARTIAARPSEASGVVGGG